MLLVLATSACVQNSSDVAVDSGPFDERKAGIRQGVQGRITAADGKPVSGAMVVPLSLDADGPPIPEIAILSDADGRYTWPLRPGRYQLTVTTPESEDVARGEVEVVEGQVSELDLEFVAGNGDR